MMAERENSIPAHTFYPCGKKEGVEVAYKPSRIDAVIMNNPASDALIS